MSTKYRYNDLDYIITLRSKADLNELINFISSNCLFLKDGFYATIDVDEITLTTNNSSNMAKNN
jgi:hypothetical protein